jgi:DNA-binding XRE family transcriptional regulator
MNVQIIEKNGKPEWAVIPYETYQNLVEDAEMLQDICDYDEAKEAIEADEELIPSEVTYAILDGENPVKVWRKYRGLTREQLATKAGVSRANLEQIESSKSDCSHDVLARIAEALGLSVDDLEP